MRIEPMNGLEDVLLIRPDLHVDDRGYFYEVFNEKEFNEKTNNKYNFHALQENESKSCKGVFRGLHFQKPPYEQAKLVRVLNGFVFDFAVDIRKDSKTFGNWVGAFLSDDSKNQFFVPRGFAHGFIVLSDEAVFEYKCDNYYNKESEGGIRWDDTEISNDILPGSVLRYSVKDQVYHLKKTFNIESLILSEKDKNRITTLKDL
jgi:dTDP-4-dehydrorhamnose 3,5-epimerase